MKLNNFVMPLNPSSFLPSNNTESDKKDKIATL